ncbi:hypothetical protein M0R36_07285 [bacterium]|jgi:hypothetical protein|nr:hypothetical protein [bacterium]
MDIGKVLDASEDRVIISAASLNYIIYSFIVLMAVNVAYIYFASFSSFINYIFIILLINMLLIFIPALFRKKVYFDNRAEKLFLKRYFGFLCIQDRAIPYKDIGYLATDFIDMDLSDKSTTGDVNVLYLALKNGKMISLVSCGDPVYFSQAVSSVKKYTKFELKRN